jgi:hypothetical protein
MLNARRYNMAKVIDDVLESSIEGDSLDDAEVVNTAQPAEAKQEPNPEDDLPEKYKGKSVKDIVAMHQEAERLIGKQGSEVGELRRVVDDFIKAQTSKDLKTNTEHEINEEDFFVDPKTSINKAIESHPSVKEAKLAAREMKRVETLSKIQSAFPDVQEIVQDANFVDWVKSSRVRTELFVRAENDFDFDAATELLSTWKEKQEITKKAVETSKVDRNSQLKSADVSTSSSTESVPKKKYRRSDIIKLMQTDRDRYEAMQDEIMAAYAEGRVI